VLGLLRSAFGVVRSWLGIRRAERRARDCDRDGHEPMPETEGLWYDKDGKPIAVHAICARCKTRYRVRSV
jgi:hypothetical protein